MEPPSTRPWLGVGAALGALPAAGGCFCTALLLAVIADSDPGGVYQQHRWLGAVVAAGASCAYVAMMGWATLRHGGLPSPVLLMALVLAGVPFFVPGVLFLPAAVVAVAGCAVLATRGLRSPAASADGTRSAAVALTGIAVLLVAAHVIAVDLLGAPRAPRAEVLSEQTSSRAVPAREKPPARPGGKEAARAPAADARRFVRDYYAALDAHDFATAWSMLSPGVQRAFGGFAVWKRGYANTGPHNLGRLRIAVADGAAIVGVTLRAGSRAACDTVVARRFAVTWRLVRTEAGLRAAAAKGRKISGTEPC